MSLPFVLWQWWVESQAQISVSFVWSRLYCCFLTVATVASGGERKRYTGQNKVF